MRVARQQRSSGSPRLSTDRLSLKGSAFDLTPLREVHSRYTLGVFISASSRRHDGASAWQLAAPFFACCARAVHATGEQII